MNLQLAYTLYQDSKNKKAIIDSHLINPDKMLIYGVKLCLNSKPEMYSFDSLKTYSILEKI